MPDYTRSGAIVCVLLILCAAAPAASETGWLVVDGFFNDWNDVPVAREHSRQFMRTLLMLEPDVVCVQEINDHTAEHAAGLVEYVFPCFAWHREIQNPGGDYDLPEGTPIVIADNMNMYGRSIQHRQLLEGIFADAAT